MYLEGADKPLALFVDTVESPGDLLIHSVSNETLPYISGSVRLLDQRLIVLLADEDFENVKVPHRFGQKSVEAPRLLILGELDFSNTLNQRVIDMVRGVSESDAIATMQEQQPHAIFIDRCDLFGYSNFLRVVSTAHLTCFVHLESDRDHLAKSNLRNVCIIHSSAELESELRKLVAEPADSTMKSKD